MNNPSNGGRPARAPAKARSAKPKKAHYISFNDEELARLRQLGFRERWAYLEMKALSNWKDGTCGEFDRQCLSYAQIAGLVTAPATQGRGQGSIDDTQAADFLARMEAVGLVANIGRRFNGGLRFDMPLSPIRGVKAASSGEVEGMESGKFDRISPDQTAPKDLANPAPATVCEESTPSLTVMINKELKNSNDGADSADAETAPRRASGAAPIRENLTVQPPAAPRLSAREIQEAVESDWTFADAAAPESLALYQSWADAGISQDDLEGAMTSLSEDPAEPALKPVNLAAKLWPTVVDGWFDQLAAGARHSTNGPDERAAL